MSIDHMKNLVKEDFEAVNALLIERLQEKVGLLGDVSQYIVQGGGKRLRPLMALLCSHACGYTGTDHITLAGVVESFHTASLLHDDVIDESTLRRGRETANSVWGGKACILVGDCLLTQSMQLLVEVGNMPILRLFSDTSHQMCCGEVRQLANMSNADLTYEEYFEVIRAKTAILFATSAAMPAYLITSDHTLQEGLYNYGLHVGNAFQIVDDALDYSSDAKTLGKNVGDDLAEGKTTLPLIYALQHGTNYQQEIIRKSLQQGTLEHLAEVLEAIEQTQAIQYTMDVAAKEVELALNTLNALPLPPSVYKEALVELANYAIKRKF